MTEDQKRVFPVECPVCRATHWIDPQSQKILKTEKSSRKKKGDLDDMLTLEKKRQQEFSRKFEATAELQKKKYQKAEEKFKRAFDSLDDKKETDR